MKCFRLYNQFCTAVFNRWTDCYFGIFEITVLGYIDTLDNTWAVRELSESEKISAKFLVGISLL